MNQEQIIQIQTLEQEFNQLNEQLHLIEENIKEINELKTSLEEIEKLKKTEILINLGKKIYIPVEIKNKNLIVEVGKQNFVKKTIPETKELINRQLKKLAKGKEEIFFKLETLQKEMTKLVEKIEKEQKIN